jgi:hypothetical protein
MIEKFRVRVRRAVQVYGASVAITLGQLGYYGASEPARQKTAIERIQPELAFGVFDPREVVARRIILTVPLSERRSAGDPPIFVPN